MLERYQNNSPPSNDDKWKNNGVTKTWDRLMLQVMPVAVIVGRCHFVPKPVSRGVYMVGCDVKV